jgi:tripartite ATP-independent transporter DctM subunit
MYLLIGEVIYHTGIATSAMDALEQWIGAIPGRLSLLAILGGVIFATLSGSSVAGTLMLGLTLVPEMEKRGYKKAMSLGPILGSGGLSIMIPPTALGILLASLAKISVGGILIAIIVPGLLMAIFYASYVIIRCWLQPSLAPPYEVAKISIRKKLVDAVRYVLPLGLILFFVIVVVFFGIATPAEAAALGALSSFILAAVYGKLSWGAIKKALMGTVTVTVMIYMIFANAMAFSQILAYCGATSALVQVVAELPLPNLVLVFLMQLILIFMGTFMEPLSIMMVTIPIFMPIAKTLGFDLLWFGAIMLLNMEIATVSPPFGLALFAMKGVSTPDTTMADIYKATMPFVTLDFIVIILMMVNPSIVLWLPSKMIIR